MSNNNNPVEYLSYLKDQQAVSATEPSYETCDGTPSGCSHLPHGEDGCGLRSVFGVCPCTHHSKQPQPLGVEMRSGVFVEIFKPEVPADAPSLLPVGTQVEIVGPTIDDDYQCLSFHGLIREIHGEGGNLQYWVATRWFPASSVQTVTPPADTCPSLVKNLRARIVELEGDLNACEANLAGSVELVSHLQEQVERFKAAVAAPGLAHIRRKAGLEPIWLGPHG